MYAAQRFSGCLKTPQGCWREEREMFTAGTSASKVANPPPLDWDMFTAGTGASNVVNPPPLNWEHEVSEG